MAQYPWYCGSPTRFHFAILSICSQNSSRWRWNPPRHRLLWNNWYFWRGFRVGPMITFCVIWLQMKPFFSSTRPFWILTFFTSAPKIPPDDTEIPLDIDYEGVQPEQMEAAKCLFETVGAVLGRSARAALSVRAGFYELGGNSLNSIYTITRLRDRGYYIRKLLAVLLIFFSGILNLWRFYEVWLDFTEAWFHNFRYVK